MIGPEQLYFVNSMLIIFVDIQIKNQIIRG